MIVIHKTGGYCVTIKNDETGTLQSGGANVMDKVPNVVIQINDSKESGGKQPYQQNRVYDADGISPALHQLSDRMKIKVKSATTSGYEEAKEGDSINYSVPNLKTRRGRVGVGVAQTLDTQVNQSVIVAQRGRGEKGNTKQQLETNTTNTTNTLTGVQKDNMLMRGFRIRRLTEIECERLQGFPDNWTMWGNYDGEIKKISRTQRYKMCGNAVTVDIVELIGRKLLETLK